MKTNRTARTLRTITAIAAIATSSFATSNFLAAPHASAATPNFGSCDFGTPSFDGFVCVDSDDLEVSVGAAHTDNGPFSDELDVDWYINSANVRMAKVRGEFRVEPGNVGEATFRVLCVNTDGTVQAKPKIVSIATSNGLHLGINKSASFTCRGESLNKVRVTVSYTDALNRTANASGAKAFGD